VVIHALLFRARVSCVCVGNLNRGVVKVKLHWHGQADKLVRWSVRLGGLQFIHKIVPLTAIVRKIVPLATIVYSFCPQDRASGV